MQLLRGGNKQDLLDNYFDNMEVGIHEPFNAERHRLDRLFYYCTYAALYRYRWWIILIMITVATIMKYHWLKSQMLGQRQIPGSI